MSSEKPDQIQASVAAALSRLRGDLGPSGAAAPKFEERHEGERARPANDVRGDPFFRSIQSPPPGTGMTAPGHAPIPMTPFPRMQAAREPAAEPPSAIPPDLASDDEPVEMPEAPSAIDMPDMPERAASADTDLEPRDAASELEAPPQLVAPVAAAPASNPFSRVMRGTAAPASGGPAQPDLLADLPPPISEPLMADTESPATRRRRRNRRLLALAAVIVVVAIGAWLWTGSQPSTDVPVITADATPEKVKPAEEGGLQVQNQDVQVLDPSAATPGETVMPEPEQPITPPAATAPGETPSAEQAPTVVDGASGTETAGTAVAPETQPAPGVPLVDTPLPALEENAPAPQPAEPATAESAPAVAAPEPTQAAEAPAAAEPGQPDTAAETAPAQAEDTTPAPAQATAPEPAPAAQPEAPAAQPAQTQEAAATPSAPAPVAAGGDTRVQLAAGKSEAAVQQEWAALQKAHPQLLGDLSLTVERVDKGAGGVFYRLQAGPLADKNAARELCSGLKARGQDCIVVSK